MHSSCVDLMTIALAFCDHSIFLAWKIFDPKKGFATPTLFYSQIPKLGPPQTKCNMLPLKEMSLTFFDVWIIE